MIRLEHTLHAEEQLCFVHIPKTAGTTLISLLDAHFPVDCICPAQLWRELVWLPRAQVSQYQLLRGHYTYDDYRELVPNPVFISMFRNPIDRACSYYNFMRNQSDDWLERHYGYREALAEVHPNVAALVEGDIEIYQRANQDDLSTFFGSPFVQNWIQNWQVKAIARSSFDPSPWDTEAVLDRAKKRLATLAWFGIVERFADSMALLSYTFGWNPVRRYQRLMVASNPNYTEGLSSKTVDVLHEIHQLDLALYQDAVDALKQRYEMMQQELRDRYSGMGLNDALESHYRDRTQALAHPRQTVIDLKFDQAIAGTGWHLREGSVEDHAIFRWIGPESQSTLDLPLVADQDFTLKLRAVGAISEDVLESLQVSVGDRPIPLTQLCREIQPDLYLVLLEGVIPADVISPDTPFTRLTFSVKETRSLHSLDASNPDRRPVGVAFDWIRLVPKAALGDEDYPYMLFPGDDDAWLTVARWLRSHLSQIQTVIAPFEFLEVVPNQVLPYHAIAQAQAIPNGEHSIQDADWIVIHKGMLDTLPLTLLNEIVASWTPVYADTVFVVFTTHHGIAAIAADNADLKAFRADYIALLRSSITLDESGNGGDRYILFPTDDPAWNAAAEWLQTHRSSIDQIIAPVEFLEVLPNRTLPYNAIVNQQTINADWLVVHKGMLDVLPRSFLDQVEVAWRPVYANAVFIIVTTRPEMAAIAPDNADLQAFREAHIALVNAQDSGENYRYLRFPGDDPAWDAVARWLRAHRNAIHQTIAPSEFTEVFNQVVSYEAVSEDAIAHVNWIVIHKGMLNALPLSLLDAVEKAWNPVYANSVFVVFTTQLDVKAIAANNPDLQAFRDAYKALRNPETPTTNPS